MPSRTEEEIRLWKEDMKIDSLLLRNTGKSHRLFIQFFTDLGDWYTSEADRLEMIAEVHGITPDWKRAYERLQHLGALYVASLSK